MYAAQTAREAFHKLETNSYDVVISDYDMPFMNGITFLKTIRNKNINTPIILFTGADKDKIICQAMEKGISSYIQKMEIQEPSILNYQSKSGRL